MTMQGFGHAVGKLLANNQTHDFFHYASKPRPKGDVSMIKTVDEYLASLNDGREV
jgi:hypothetical protein